MTTSGEPSRLLAPGVAVLLGYVLLIGNPWVNRDAQITVTDSDSAVRVLEVMISYPRWQLDLDRFGPFEFWSANLRTVLFVGLAGAGLSGTSRWLREVPKGMAVFVATVGTVALSAVAAGIAAAILITKLLYEPEFLSNRNDATTEYVLGQLSASAAFGVLFGLVLGLAVVMPRQVSPPAANRRNPAEKRRAKAPKSFW